MKPISYDNRKSLLKQSPIPKKDTIKYTDLPGIYKIECLITNAVYIGQSNNISQRLATHRSNLRSGKHICPPLQEDYSKHGESNFVFEGIHQSDEASLLALETFYINEHEKEGYIIYNTIKYTSNTDLLTCNKNHKAILLKLSDLLDSGKITVNELEQMVMYKSNSW